MKILDIQKLNVTYNSNSSKAVEDASFSLYQNQNLGIVGESGSGKSTLVNAIFNLIKSPYKISGTIKIKDMIVPNKQREKQQFYQQNIWGQQLSWYSPDSQEVISPYFNIDKQMNDNLFCHKKQPKYAQKKKKLAETIYQNSPNILNKLAANMSGGEQQRAMILIMNFPDSNFVIADEFTSKLDTIIQKKLLKTLLQINESKSMLFITHNISLLNQVLHPKDKIIVMNKGRIVEEFTKKNDNELIDLKDLHHPYTRKLISEYQNNSTFYFNEQTTKNTGCPFVSYCNVFENASLDIKQDLTNQCQNTFPTATIIKTPTGEINRVYCYALEENKKEKLSHLLKGNLREKPKPCDKYDKDEKKEEILRLKNVSIRYTGQTKDALKEISLVIYQGENLGIIGESGSGKSTLGKIMTLLLTPSNKNIKVEGELFLNNKKFSPKQLTNKELAKNRVLHQMIFQNFNDTFIPQMRIKDILGEALASYHKHFDVKSKDFTCSLLKKMNLFVKEDSYPHNISSGQWKRLLLARALIAGGYPQTKIKLLVADEPLSNVDAVCQQEIIELLKQISIDNNITYAIISHNIRVIESMCTRIAVLYQGYLVEVFSLPFSGKRHHPYTQALYDSIPSLDNKWSEQKIEITPNTTNQKTGCPYRKYCMRYQELSTSEKQECQEKLPKLKPIDEQWHIACHY